MEPKKFCASCAWFRVEPNVKKPSVIKGGKEIIGGFCCYNPPKAEMVMIQGLQGPQQSFTPVRPAVFPDEFCRMHSALDAGLNVEPLVYDPVRYEGNMGFNRPPTLAEAMRFAPKGDLTEAISKAMTDPV